jgi:Ca-activated chloride channel family protein
VILFFCLLVAALGAAPVNADAPRFAAESRLVVLSATAVDKKGRPVRDLRPEELQIFERGKRQRIVHFGQARATQARVLLVVDASGSMEGELRDERVRGTIEQILYALDPQDEVALAGFDHRYWGIVAFTRDRAAIRRGLAELTPFGSTALHDALDKGAHDLASHGEGRRAVIVLTDGVDTASEKQPDEVIAHSQALDVPIYAISVVSPLDDPESSSYVGPSHQGEAATNGQSVLRRYADMSGGAAFVVSDHRRLSEAARQIVEELKHQYRLGYDPPDGPPGFRTIEVRTTRKGVRVRTRNGYVPAS